MPSATGSGIESRDASRHPANPPSALTIEQATICPPTAFSADPAKRGGISFDGGVYDEQGDIVPLARHILGGKANIGAARQPCAATDHLTGTYLYLGWLREHFGNFFEESLDRVWHFDRLDAPVDGVIYQLYHETGSWFGHAAAHAELITRFSFVTEFLRLSGIDVPLTVICVPTLIDRLIVPEPIGIHRRRDNAAGVAEQRALFGRIAKRVAVTGTARRLYVSRSALPAQLGKHLLETEMEANLARQGYSVLFPEKMTIDQQIAAYADAREIVVAEGTPIHLIAAFAPSEARVAIIARRHPVPPRFLHQLKELAFDEVLLIQERIGAVRAFAGDAGSARADQPNDQFSHIALDFQQVGKRLAERNFIEREDWRVPDMDFLQIAIDAAIAARKETMPAFTYRYVADPISASLTQGAGRAPQREGSG